MLSATRLFVGNLPKNTEEDDLRSAFSVFGDITTLDLKSKPGADQESKKFAFVSLSASNMNVEACIKHFSSEQFNGHQLYVTRARESFLERLQREREQAQQKQEFKNGTYDNLPKKNPKLRLGDKLNPGKRKIVDINTDNQYNKRKKAHNEDRIDATTFRAGDSVQQNNLKLTEADMKKQHAEKKRLESMKKKRQEFKEKKMIIKSGLTVVDKVQNKKVIFTDHEEEEAHQNKKATFTKDTTKRKNHSSLFDDDSDESDKELNFEIKKQFEGKKGQKVLDLQSRYKSDKRFTLDERFIDDEEEEESQPQTKNTSDNEEDVEIGTEDEKARQMNILQDVLGVTIKQKFNHAETDTKKAKQKLGMLRFDPLQPDHAKFLAPVENKPELTKKSKKKAKDKERQEEVKEPQPEPEVPKVEVSKEQFYKVSETLKEAIAQPSSFSLRSLFGNNENDDEGSKGTQQTENYIPLEAPKQKKVKNPLDPKEKNPFVYDSSDSETEEPETKKVEIEQPAAPVTEPKAIWKENLFFSEFDTRLKEGLAFFNKIPEDDIQKERRELKSLMKKRIYNKDRKSQMFKKKIGGRKKIMKKPRKTKT